MKSKLLTFILIWFVLAATSCDVQSERRSSLAYKNYIDKAKHYMTTGEGEKAISAYKKAIEIKPIDSKTHLALGEIYYGEWARSYDLAQKSCQYDVLTNPEKKRGKDITKELKRYGLRSEYKDLAMQEFKEAIKYAPKDWVARYYIAADYFNNKMYKEAIDEFEKVVEINPGHSYSFGVLEEAYFEIGTYDLAAEHLKKAIQLDRSYEYGYYMLGKVYLAMSNAEKANEMLRKLKSMNSVLYDKLRLYMFSEERKDLGAKLQNRKG